MKNTFLLLGLLGILSNPVNALEIPARLMLTTGNTLSLTWIAPDSRKDGKPLDPSEIGGYEVAYSCNGEPTSTFNIDPTKVSYVTPVMPVGTCEFAIATYDTNGLYSEFTAPISIDITSTTGPAVITFQVVLGN